MVLHNQPLPQNQPRARRHDVGRGLVDLTLMFVVSGTFGVTFATAQRLPLPWVLILPAILMVLLGNVIYFGIYELEHHRLIGDERCTHYIGVVQGWCLVPNLFAPVPPTIRPWPQHVWTEVARVVAQLLGA